jgi:molybdenum ABC transporter molybdate-binding protein
MPKSAKKQPKTAVWTGDWRVGIRVWVERNGVAVLGEGRAELLAAVQQQRSITKAAKAAKISYRKAWNLIQEVNTAAGEPLVEAAVGGAAGGGASLTERGKLVLTAYEEVRRSMKQSAAGALLQAVNAESESTPCLHLAAAISLQDAIGELLADFALQMPTVRVRAVFGASNELADHVLAGAPCDLFIAAEKRELDRLVAGKRLLPKPQRLIATNRLAVIGREGAPQLRKIKDLLSERIRCVVLAEPECPLGRYSKAYLESVGIYQGLLPKVLHVDNSRAVPAAISSGAADVGIAFISDAGRADFEILLRIVSEKAEARYFAGVGENFGEQCGSLIRFFESTLARKCFTRCGFEVPSL